MKYANRVEDTVASVASAGLGIVTLAGTPPTLRKGLSAIGTTGDTFPYGMEQNAAWEHGIATIVGTNQISRAPSDSSAGGSAVAFSAGARFYHDVDAATLAKMASVDTLPFAAAIPLTAPGTRYMPQQTVSAVIGFTVAANPVQGALVYVRLVADGANAPTFTGFKEWGGSQGYDNRNGIANQVQFFYDGVDYWYSISQAVGAVAVDNIVPTVSSAAVANASPTVVVLTMSEAMDPAYVPAASAFTVGGHTVSSVAISGSFINLTCSAAFVNGEAARTVSYAQPGTNNARDLAGNLLGAFTGTTITNNVQAVDSAAPSFTSAQVANATPTVIQVTMNETLANSVPAASAFAVSGGKTVSSVSLAGAVVSVTVNSAYVNGDVITVTYTQPGANPRLQDAAGNATTSFGPSAVTNNVGAAATAPGAPTIGTATAGDGYVDVAFTVGSDGGSAITNNTATLSTGETASGTTSPIRVTAANGTARTAHVTSTNGVGTGAASAESNSVTPAAASFPRLTSLSFVTESGTGPYSYTSTAGGGFGTKGGVLNQALQSGVDGSFSVSSGTVGEFIVGLTPNATMTTFASMVLSLYSGGPTGNWTAFTAGATQTAANTLARQNGDIPRLRRVGSSVIGEVARAASPTTFTTIYTWTGISTGVLRYDVNLNSAGTFDTLTTSGLA